MLFPAIQVRAASITVNSSCSLADAITAANSDSNSHNTSCTAGSGDDTITLTSNIILSAEPTAIASNITIEGENRTISGNNTVRILRINSGTVRINNLTLRNGRAATAWSSLYAGGAILNVGGTLTVSKSHFIDNVTPPDTNTCATTSDYGGAIASFGSNRLTVLDSVFRGNRSTNGIAIEAGRNAPVTIRRSSFTGHGLPDNIPNPTHCSTAKVMNFGHGADISNVTISGNSAKALQITEDETTTIRHSTIVNNTSPFPTATGGISQGSGGSMRLYNSIIADNGARNCDTDFSSWLQQNVNNLIKTRIVRNAQGEIEEFNDCGTTSTTITDDPRLASFRGSPGYRPLIEGSPAIDAGDTTQCANLPLVNGQRVDIRGVARDDGACDLGSYEGFLALPKDDDDDVGVSSTPVPYMFTRCADCPDLLAQGYRLKARNGLDSGVQFRRVGAGAIGDQSLLSSGFLDAIDVFGWAEQGVGVCFPGAGSLLFLDAAFSPRAPVPLSGYTQEGLTCADIDRPGTLLLLSATPLAAGRLSSSVAPAPARGLSDCMVTTEAILNFRVSPGGPRVHFVDRWGDQIAGWLPRGVTLTALERTADWFRVDYHGTQGWVSAEWVTPHGVCG